jgi:hypothetical protein
MGAFDFLFKRPKEAAQVNGYFKMLDGYTPIFTSYDGGVYEMELTRACIHTFANHCSKLQPSIQGADLRDVKAMLENKPNPFMTSAQFVYKAATIYEAKNTCIITPVLDKFDRLIGYYPVNPAQTEVIDVKGEPFLRYRFKSGQWAAIELYRCGIVSKFLYNSDIFGEDNKALQPTLQLLSMQNQGIAEGIKNSASFRFMATVKNFAKSSDIAKERQNWVTENLGGDAGGLALFPNSYTDVKQITSQAKVVDPEQMDLIQTRVLNYFGTNEEVLQNNYGEYILTTDLTYKDLYVKQENIALWMDFFAARETDGLFYVDHYHVEDENFNKAEEDRTTVYCPELDSEKEVRAKYIYSGDKFFQFADIKDVAWGHTNIRTWGNGKMVCGKNNSFKVATPGVDEAQVTYQFVTGWENNGNNNPDDMNFQLDGFRMYFTLDANKVEGDFKVNYYDRYGYGVSTDTVTLSNNSLLKEVPTGGTINASGCTFSGEDAYVYAPTSASSKIYVDGELVASADAA